MSGIRIRHQRTCNSRVVGSGQRRRKCNCTPGYLPEASLRGQKVRGTTCRTLAEAIGVRDTLRAQLSATAHLQGAQPAPTPAPAAPLWQDVAEETADAIEAGTFLTRTGTPYKPSTARSVVKLLRGRLVEEACGLTGKTLAEIEPRHIDALKMHLGVPADKGGPGLAPNSICRHLDVIGIVWRYAYVIHGYEGACPTDRVRRPRSKRRVKTIDHETARKMIDTLPKTGPVRAVYITALMTGMRRGELFGLRWEDVDLVRDEIHVQQTWNPDTRTFGTPKSDTGARTIPIEDSLRKELVRWRFETGRSSGIVFSADGARPFDPAGIYRKGARRWSKAGLDVSGFHVCRRTFATSLATCRTDAFTIQRLMGHADISTTALYIADRPDVQRAAVKKMGAMYAAR